jgi:hypothetical protein
MIMPRGVKYDGGREIMHEALVELGLLNRSRDIVDERSELDGLSLPPYQLP